MPFHGERADEGSQSPIQVIRLVVLDDLGDCPHFFQQAAVPGVRVVDDRVATFRGQGRLAEDGEGVVVGLLASLFRVPSERLGLTASALTADAEDRFFNTSSRSRVEPPVLVTSPSAATSRKEAE